jgi:hypothetical protein
MKALFHHAQATHVPSATSTLTFTKLADNSAAPFAKTLLNSSQVLVLDTGKSVFLWLGSKAQVPNVRSQDHLIARQYLKFVNKPAGLLHYVSVAIVKEGHESKAFLALFH